ncbi:DoxX family protein [Roseivirga pacifica]|uniref:DoxX family protein n=1 Tax=Roseivirga pacifica TaxID=1267423 RepID=UPI003BB0ADE9
MKSPIKHYQPLSTNASIAALLIRVVFSFCLFYGHGLGKVKRLFSGEPIRFLDPIGLGPEISLALATGAEVLGAFLILIGLYTRWASIPVIFTLLVACFMVHGSDGFSTQEKLFLYIIGFAAVLISGPGKYSVDARINSK